MDCQGGVTEVEVAPGTKGGVPYAVGLGAGGFDAIETFVPPITLSGADSLAHYQQVLRSVTYDNSAPVPQAGARTVLFLVRDDNSTGVPLESSVRIEAARNSG